MNKKSGKFKLVAPLLAVVLSVGGFIGIEAASSAVVAASTPKVDVVSGATTVKATNPVIEKTKPVQTPAKIIVEKNANVVSPTTTVTAVAPKVDVVSVTEQTRGVIIGEEKAREIALGLVNGEIIKLKLDDEDCDYEDYDDEDYDNERSYEIEILKNNIKYEIEINAYTGLVLEFELEDDDHDNNLDKITDDKDDIDDDSNEDMYQDGDDHDDNDNDDDDDDNDNDDDDDHDDDHDDDDEDDGDDD